MLFCAISENYWKEDSHIRCPLRYKFTEQILYFGTHFCVLCDKHVEKIFKKVGSGIAMLRNAEKFIPRSSLQMIYNALLQSYFDYCSPLWDICGKHLLDKLQKFRNHAVRIVAGLSYEIDSADALG